MAAQIMTRRSFVRLVGSATASASAAVLSACSGTAASSGATASSAATATGTIWNPHATADRIVVVSDLHFGVSDSFSQDVSNRDRFVEFVGKLVDVGDVRELVIAGDFLDEWIVPMAYPSHSDSGEFYRKCFSNNRAVFDALEAAAAAGIKVVYVPGNHDMTLTEEVLAEALPHATQARDANGLGVYRTGDRGEIAIEHCHRYDVYSAPDTVSNRDLDGASETILPPGYFYAQLGTEWVAEGKPHNAVGYPVIETAPDSADVDQTGAYLHYEIMTSILLTKYTPNVGFEDKIFAASFAGLPETYSEYDICPRLMDDGSISAPTLYRDFQRTWNERQETNEVQVKNDFLTAATGTSSPGYFRSQAAAQYIENPGSGIEVVVFGHTHIPDFHDYGNGRYYLNEGTWIDENLDSDVTRTFAVITTGAADTAALFSFGEDGTVVDITSERIDV